MISSWRDTEIRPYYTSSDIPVRQLTSFSVSYKEDTYKKKPSRKDKRARKPKGKKPNIYYDFSPKFGIGKNRNFESKQLFKFQKIKRKIKKFKEKRKGLMFLCGKCKKLSKVKIEWLKTWYNINIQVFNKWRFLCLSL